MLDHISLRVQDFPRAVAFYRAALAPIGYDVVMEFPDVAGLGAGGKPDLWIMKTDQALNPTHVAFVSERDRIDAFHAAALGAGAIDNGAPGIRPDYHPHYYSAFVYDPEGNNIEVVCHESPEAAKSTPVRAAAKRAARKPAKKAGTKPGTKPSTKPATKLATKVATKASGKSPSKAASKSPTKLSKAKPAKKAPKARTKANASKKRR